jgi:hypothetical protein
MDGSDASKKSLFLSAIEMATRQERIAFLDGACDDNPQLRQEVDALLEAHDRLASHDAANDGGEPASEREVGGSFWSRSAKGAWRRSTWRSKHIRLLAESL